MRNFMLNGKQIIAIIKSSVKTAIVAFVGAFAKKYTAKVIKNFG